MINDAIDSRQLCSMQFIITRPFTLHWNILQKLYILSEICINTLKHHIKTVLDKQNYCIRLTHTHTQMISCTYNIKNPTWTNVPQIIVAMFVWIITIILYINMKENQSKYVTVYTHGNKYIHISTCMFFTRLFYP